MKRYIRSSQTPKYKHEYTDHMVYTWGPRKYSVYFKNADDPENFQCQVSEIHPYDDAKYTWAKKDSPAGATLYRNKKLVDTIAVKEYDEDDYEDENEYINDVIVDICRALKEANKDVEPRMVHY